MTITRTRTFSLEQIFEGLERAHYAPFNPLEAWEDYEPKFELLTQWKATDGGSLHLVRRVATQRFHIAHSYLGDKGIVFDSFVRIEDAIVSIECEKGGCCCESTA